MDLLLLKYSYLDSKFWCDENIHKNKKKVLGTKKKFDTDFFFMGVQNMPKNVFSCFDPLNVILSIK